MIAEERRRAADLIEPLTAEQLRTPSLCGKWTVHDVAAHLLMPLVTPMSTFMEAMVTSFFN
ncbi:MAG: maleylpyruvate isomerase N-terminal domain-containing protein, partial [Sporichthyaceae bacterium]|nr:maleylpyruvate isomerase N-terminal domain-containing protein [Sporichthyaceae bacterium]